MPNVLWATAAGWLCGWESVPAGSGAVREKQPSPLVRALA